MRFGVLISILAAGLQGEPPTPPATASLTPSGKWGIEYADNMCILSRAYGTAAEPLTFGFRQLPTSPGIQLFLVNGRGTGEFYNGTGKDGATISLNSIGRTISADYTSSRQANDRKTRMTIISLATEDYADIIKADLITVSARGVPTTFLALKGVEKARAALKSCNDDMLRAWQIDPGEADLIAEQPSANPANWVTSDDYPAAALGKQGKTTSVFRIGTDGRITDCRTVNSSGTPILDTTACELIVRRGRYKPAIGKDGKPMAVHKSVSFTWVSRRVH